MDVGVQLQVLIALLQGKELLSPHCLVSCLGPIPGLDVLE
jgi:hypothetical protein